MCLISKCIYNKDMVDLFVLARIPNKLTKLYYEGNCNMSSNEKTKI